MDATTRPQISKHLIFASMLMLCLLLSGCFNIVVDQKIDREGNSEIVMTTDLSAMVGTLESLGESMNRMNASGIGSNRTNITRRAYTSSNISKQLSDLNQNLTDACEKFKQDTHLLDAECTVDEDYVIHQSGRASLKGTRAFKIEKSIPYITYKYDMTSVQDFIGDNDLADKTPLGSDKLTGAQGKMAKNMAQMMGLEFTYNLEMPGKIIKTSVGEIVGDNRVKVDMLDIYDKKGLYVESREINIVWCAAFGALYILLVAAIIVLAVMIIRRRRSGRAGIRFRRGR